MDKIRSMARNLSLKKSIVLYITVFAIIAIILCMATSLICEKITENILAAYPLSGERYYLTNEKGERLGDGTIIGTDFPTVSEKDSRLISILSMLPAISAPVISGICIILAALLFYRNKLREPLRELKTASEKISDNDLDFRVNYNSRDELGQLCNSFEIMRNTLAKNFSEMWRQVEERKRLNAAFAHDLRTPLTVLKGYNEMLQASDYARTRETAATMGKHISRMETYVSSMSNLQRLEDAQPECRDVLLQPFLSSLRESAEIVCAKNGKELRFQNGISAPQLSVDTDFISQVCYNLIANAVRYAAAAVTLSFSLYDRGLLLSVSDDGKGFGRDALDKAAGPYYTEETDRSEHFGLGLYICKLLCEHHNGCLKIENTPNGARVSAFFESASL